MTINGVTCHEESTSGWSERRRRLRRERFSDEFALLMLVAAQDERRVYLPEFSRFDVQSLPTVDGTVAEPHAYAFGESLGGDFSSTDVAFAEIRIQGLELEGVGATADLAQRALTAWNTSLFFEPSGGSSVGWYSFAHPHYQGRDHNILFEDFWFFDTRSMLEGGQEPAGVLQPGDGVATRSVPEWLESQRITRTVSRQPHEVQTYERRRYVNAATYSDYELGIYYAS